MLRSGSRDKETNREAIVVLQVRDDDGLGEGGSSGVGEKWSHSVYVLKVEPTKFTARWDVGNEKRQVKDDSIV